MLITHFAASIAPISSSPVQIERPNPDAPSTNHFNVSNISFAVLLIVGNAFSNSSVNTLIYPLSILPRSICESSSPKKSSALRISLNSSFTLSNSDWNPVNLRINLSNTSPAVSTSLSYATIASRPTYMAPETAPTVETKTVNVLMNGLPAPPNVNNVTTVCNDFPTIKSDV